MTTDQRGLARPQGAGCEIGAYEGGLPQTYTVTKVVDTNDGVCDSDCSLREAINAANSNPASTVMIPASFYTLGILGAGENGGATGDLDINADMTIIGAGATTTTIDASDLAPDPDRVLHITGPYTVNISGVTISRGTAAGPSPLNAGGGILNDGGHLTLNNSTITLNQASAVSGFGGGVAALNGATTILNTVVVSNNSSGDGAGIFNSTHGVLIALNSDFTGNIAAPGGAYGGGGLLSDADSWSVNVSDSTFSNNESNGGGAIYSFSPSLIISNSVFSNNRDNAVYAKNVTITDSTFTGNENTNAIWGEGGAVFTFGILEVSDSTFVGNEAVVGAGAIYGWRGANVIRNSTFVDNAAAEGGAVLVGADADLPFIFTHTSIVHSTFQGNDATTGGGVWVEASGGLNLIASIFDSNTGGNCGLSASPGGAIQSSGYNLSNDASCAASFTATGDQNSTDPLLGTLGSFGGLTQTIPLLSGSPAIDVIPAGNCVVASDQRGVARPVGAGCDSGAFEGEVTPPTDEAPERNYFTTNTPTLTWVGQAGAAGYEVQVASDASFSSVVYASTILPPTAREVTTDALADGLYYWRVRAVNGQGIGGNWSKSDTFVVDAG